MRKLEHDLDQDQTLTYGETYTVSFGLDRQFRAVYIGKIEDKHILIARGHKEVRCYSFTSFGITSEGIGLNDLETIPLSKEEKGLANKFLTRHRI